MLAAQMQKSADKAMAAVSVVITAARPVAVVGKMLEHQIERSTEGVPYDYLEMVKRCALRAGHRWRAAVVSKGMEGCIANVCERWVGPRKDRFPHVFDRYPISAEPAQADPLSATQPSPGNGSSCP
jgi:hypothetical protein